MFVRSASCHLIGVQAPFDRLLRQQTSYFTRNPALLVILSYYYDLPAFPVRVVPPDPSDRATTNTDIGAN
jgi:hypothetical protein